MHRVFDVMQHLLPFALSEQALSDPAQLADAQRWIEALVRETKALQHHHAAPPEGFEHLSRALADDARSLERRFSRGDLLEAQFYILALTDTCVSCHSRLPKKRDFPLSDGLSSAASEDGLEERARLRLLVATRQFEAALAAWESIFADLERSPNAISSNGYFDDYLTIAIRVQRDPARAHRTLERLARRSSLPRYLREHVEAWNEALAWLALQPDPTPGLPPARRLIARADAVRKLPSDPRGRVYDLAASSLLHRLVAESSAPLPTPELGEALYLLGLIEARGPAGRWVSEAEIHLERSIRLAPAEAYAIEAYGLLEEYTMFQYGGASGSPIPQDRVELLQELSDLIDRARPAPAKPSSPRAVRPAG
jgi:hypothetical protein